MVHERAHHLFDGLAPEFEALPDVALGRMFGTVGLGVRGKIFAFIGNTGDLVVKVGADRVASASADGVGEAKVMRGRPMSEWLSVQIEHHDLWRDLMREACDHVDTITPR
ncbi:TfoX/Sxy family protein [Microbacterium gorillae]|uniref:TfoX/Sxy family protein n=1 Tax=Microbacterium gorillae TaxID=1231063 RepID=UPI0005909852|nr:TfoX/Sxy family protein [Microbacterium gorillae]